MSENRDYKDTLLMMQTAFPMRGNLGVNELPIEKKWEDLHIYEKVLKKYEGHVSFFLHVGRPKANGSITVCNHVKKL